MDTAELKAKLYAHLLWRNNVGGKKLDLPYADLRGADLNYADLNYADLNYADLRGADLRGADLNYADLRGADLRGADLRYADLRYADLRYADLSFSCWPLWCGSRRVEVDRKLSAQLAAHFCALDCDDPDYIAARDAIMEFAKTSHRAADLGIDHV